MTEPMLPSLEYDPPRGPATASVILLHGLGADGHDFAPIVPELGLPPDHRLRFVFPHAPEQAVTINGGMVMPAWYDIAEVDITARQDAVGIRASATRLAALIDRERQRGVETQRIVVAGFSQGGAIALHAGLRHAEPLAGILALSTYLPLADSLVQEASPANQNVPIFMGHGLYDPVVPFVHGSRSCRLLEDMGYPARLRSYRMEHTVCAEEVHDIAVWLREVLQEER